MSPTKHCIACGARLHPDRIAYGWRFCFACVDDDWSLVERTPTVVTNNGRKGGAIVERPDNITGHAIHRRA